MPKRPAGITKSKRIETLRQVLKRWGRLSKSQIDSKVAAQLGVPETQLARALYRDLDELVSDTEIVSDYFTRDGIKIETYDPDVHKNTIAEWYYPGFESHVIGHAALANSGAAFYAPKSMIRDFRIEQASAVTSFKALHIYFSFQQDFFCLSFDLRELPVKLVVGRLGPGADGNSLFDEVQKVFGKRTAFLLVPVPNVSASNPQKSLGHFVMEVRKPGQATLTDLGSTNGTKVTKLTPEEVDSLRKQGTLLGVATISKSWASTPKLKQVQENLRPESPHVTLVPVLVEASDNFRMVIV